MDDTDPDGDPRSGSDSESNPGSEPDTTTASVESEEHSSTGEDGDGATDGDGGGGDGDEPALTGTFTGVVDRFEDGLAVLVLERDGETVGEHVTGKGTLPEDAQDEDTVVKITLDDGDTGEVTYLPEETESRQMEAQDRFDRLSERPSDSDT